MKRKLKLFIKKAKELGYPATDKEAMIHLKDCVWGVVGIRNSKWLIENATVEHLSLFNLTESEFYKLRKNLKPIDIREIRESR